METVCTPSGRAAFDPLPTEHVMQRLSEALDLSKASFILGADTRARDDAESWKG